MSERTCTCQHLVIPGGSMPSSEGCAIHDPRLLDNLLEEQRKQQLIDQQLDEECVFTVGEVLLIRGGFFKVHAHSGDRLYLQFQGIAKDVMKRP